MLRPPTSSTLEEARRVLAQGGVVAHATETCYGLACDLTNPAAVARLFRIKKRPPDLPVSALFLDLEEAKRYVEWNVEADRLAAQHLPGPLTLILRLRPDPPHLLHPTPTSGKRLAVNFEHENNSLTAHSSQLIATLGVRLSSHPLAQELSARFGRPLSTTSANIHGEPNLYDAQTIADRFAREKAQPDLIIESGLLPLVPPSTVIDLTKGGKIVRK